jgi:DNA topoisomerase-1
MAIAPASNSRWTVPKKKLRTLVHDYSATAQAADLLYVNDKDEGITRKKKGDTNTFDYFFQGKKVKDKTTLERIQHLVIPPAWERVWISPQANGHIQVTGYDVKNRKQYRYHNAWSALRDETKYYRLKDFAKALPDIRKRLKTDLCKQELSKEKVLAAVVSVMESTSIRVGNSTYEKLYGSFGLSTLKDRHVIIKGDQLTFQFKGKKGVKHCISLKNRKLANIVTRCRNIPGQQLFQYIDEEGKRHGIDSLEVNNYIRTISGGDYTSKDFRTWTGTVQCLLAFKEIGFGETKTQQKKNIVEALDKVALALGNTRSVCKKHYVHPGVLSDYETRKLEKYLNQISKLETNCDTTDSLTPVEKVLLKILEES